MIENLVCPYCNKAITSSKTSELPYDTRATCKGCGIRFMLGEARLLAKPKSTQEQKEDEIFALVKAAETTPEKPKQENRVRCPYCKESIVQGAIKCKHCGETIEKTYREFKQNQIKQAYNGVSAVLSLLIPGSGQVYKGQPVNGLAWLITVPVCYVLFIPFGLFAHACCVFGASRP
jgi:DNA-directed RNA polymerase subunit M/transcription elongation factor TFIIS